jgi:hypothetical protein
MKILGVLAASLTVSYVSACTVRLIIEKFVEGP